MKYSLLLSAEVTRVAQQNPEELITNVLLLSLVFAADPSHTN